MLGKLTKHEFLSILRVAIPSYIVVLVLALIGRFLTWLTSRQYLIDNVPTSFIRTIDILSGLITVVYVLAFIALFIMTLFLMVYRFYKNFYTDEGYLMLTLPVRPSSLVLSKLLNSMIWIVLSAAIALLSLYITFGHYDQLQEAFAQVWDSLKDVVNDNEDYLKQELGVPIWVFGVEIVLFGITYFSRFVLAWYSSVSFGLLISKKHKAVGTVIAYIILQIVNYIFMGAYSIVIATIVPNYNAIVASSAGRSLQVTLIGYIAINIVYTTVLFFFTSFMMKHKLNLD